MARAFAKYTTYAKWRRQLNVKNTAYAMLDASSAVSAAVRFPQSWAMALAMSGATSETSATAVAKIA